MDSCTNRTVSGSFFLINGGVPPAEENQRYGKKEVKQLYKSCFANVSELDEPRRSVMALESAEKIIDAIASSIQDFDTMDLQLTLRYVMALLSMGKLPGPVQLQFKILSLLSRYKQVICLGSNLIDSYRQWIEFCKHATLIIQQDLGRSEQTGIKVIWELTWVEATYKYTEEKFQMLHLQLHAPCELNVAKFIYSTSAPLFELAQAFVKPNNMRSLRGHFYSNLLMSSYRFSKADPAFFDLAIALFDKLVLLEYISLDASLDFVEKIRKGHERIPEKIMTLLSRLIHLAVNTLSLDFITFKRILGFYACLCSGSSQERNIIENNVENLVLLLQKPFYIKDIESFYCSADRTRTSENIGKNAFDQYFGVMIESVDQILQAFPDRDELWRKSVISNIFYTIKKFITNSITKMMLKASSRSETTCKQKGCRRRIKPLYLVFLQDPKRLPLKKLKRDLLHALTYIRGTLIPEGPSPSLFLKHSDSDTKKTISPVTYLQGFMKWEHR